MPNGMTDSGPAPGRGTLPENACAALSGSCRQPPFVALRDGVMKPAAFISSQNCPQVTTGVCFLARASDFERKLGLVKLQYVKSVGIDCPSLFFCQEPFTDFVLPHSRSTSNALRHSPVKSPINPSVSEKRLGQIEKRGPEGPRRPRLVRGSLAGARRPP